MALSILFLAGCSRGGGSPPPTSVTTVVATTPADGDVDVEPTTPITILLSPESGGLGPADVEVSDGGNRLPGTLRQVGSSAQWLWTPEFELPRRSTISVSVQSQDAASFTVREYVQEAVFELPGEEVGFALSWSNGRRALVTASGRCFEVTSTGLVERFVCVQPGARAFGDGDFICELTEAGVHYCLRGNLDGTVDRVATPFDLPIGESNIHGDVVVFVPTTLGAPSDWGLWRLMHGDSAFALAYEVLEPGLHGALDRLAVQIAWPCNWRGTSRGLV